jgi:signal transduction histidine kinase
MHRPQSEAEGIAARQPRGILLLAPARTASRNRVAPEDPAAGLADAGLADTRLADTGLAHDARNLISALDLYCDLLASPGVLAPGFGHYAEDLRRVAGSGARLIEALTGSRNRAASHHPHALHSLTPHSPTLDHAPLRRRSRPGIEDLASELNALEAPLRALAGSEVRLEIECAPCAGRLALNSHDLLRILFNLVANAVEAMAATAAELRCGPFLRITAQRGGAASFLAHPDWPNSETPGSETVVLSVRDNGPGIPADHLPRIFEAGFSTRPENHSEQAHGLGLSIVSQLVAAAGGAVRAVSPSGLGARFDIELPILRPEARATRLEVALPEKTKIEKRNIMDFKQISAQIEKEA